jgi:6,7-dimethyl-8-ribityllumazine synthase
MIPLLELKKQKMHIIEGQLDAREKNFAIIASRFNSLVCEHLLQGATDCLLRHGTVEKNITIYRVPGAYEIPATAQRVIALQRYHALICLGVLIRGATPHFDYLAGFVAKSIGEIGVHSGVPTIFGVLTTDSLEQALERAGSKGGNKGWEAAMAAIEMANLFSQLAEKP